MTTIEYKGYVAEVEYDDEAQLYCGSVANTEPYSVVIFEIPKGYDIQREFQISVDVYLESCAADGIDLLPPLPYPTRIAPASEIQPSPDPETARI